MSSIGLKKASSLRSKSSMLFALRPMSENSILAQVLIIVDINLCLISQDIMKTRCNKILNDVGLI